MENKRKLRNILISPGIQRKIITIDILFMILVMILTMAVVEIQVVEGLLGAYGNVWHFPFGDITLSLTAKLFIFYAIILGTFIFSIGAQLWMTHRVCGALVNFTNAFNEISTGKIDRRIVMRKDDLLIKEAETFNNMMQQLSDRIKGLEKENQRLQNK